MRSAFRWLADILDVIAILVVVFALLALITSLSMIGSGAFVEWSLYLLICLALPAIAASAADRIARR